MRCARGFSTPQIPNYTKYTTIYFYLVEWPLWKRPPTPSPRRSAVAHRSQRSSRRLQRALGELADLVAEQGGAGVLAVVDEFHNLRAQDASVIASAIQQLAKDQDKPVALLGAGLAHVEHTLLPHKGFTFFQRCKRHRILNLSLLEAKEAILVSNPASSISCFCSSAGRVYIWRNIFSSTVTQKVSWCSLQPFVLNSFRNASFIALGEYNTLPSVLRSFETFVFNLEASTLPTTS